GSTLPCAGRIEASHSRPDPIGLPGKSVPAIPGILPGSPHPSTETARKCSHCPVPHTRLRDSFRSRCHRSPYQDIWHDLQHKSPLCSCSPLHPAHPQSPCDCLALEKRARWSPVEKCPAHGQSLSIPWQLQSAV